MKQYNQDMQPRKTFAQEVGIREDESARPSTWDTMHEITVARMEKAVSEHVASVDALKEELARVNQRRGHWILVAMLGWGMFAIACLSRGL